LSVVTIAEVCRLLALTAIGVAIALGLKLLPTLTSKPVAAS
jgi:hypothetical protein